MVGITTGRNSMNSLRSFEMAKLKEVKPITVSIPTLHVLTGLSEGLLYLKANEGSLPGCRRIGKRFIIHLQTFEDYMRNGMGS